jgi:hypothetical protein
VGVGGTLLLLSGAGTLLSDVPFASSATTRIETYTFED